MSDAGDGPSDDEGTGTGEGGLPRLDQYFDALSNRRRRHVLYYLDDRGSASVDELARDVVARETGRPPDDLSEAEYARVQSELHHSHLPRLADYGLVEFDPRSRMVRFREPTRTFAALLQVGQLVEEQRL